MEIKFTKGMPWRFHKEIHKNATETIEKKEKATECILKLIEMHYGSGVMLEVADVLNADVVEKE